IGDSVPFKIDVTNVGNGPATGVTLNDKLPAGLEHPQGERLKTDLGTIPPGETRTVTLVCKATAVGRYVNEVTAVGADGIAATGTPAAEVGQAKIRFTKRGPSQRMMNAETTFVLEAANVGSDPAQKVQIIDTLPGTLTFSQATDNGQFDKSTNTVHWEIGTL